MAPRNQASSAVHLKKNQIEMIKANIFQDGDEEAYHVGHTLNIILVQKS